MKQNRNTPWIMRVVKAVSWWPNGLVAWPKASFGHHSTEIMKRAGCRKLSMLTTIIERKYSKHGKNSHERTPTRLHEYFIKTDNRISRLDLRQVLSNKLSKVVSNHSLIGLVVALSLAVLQRLLWRTIESSLLPNKNQHDSPRSKALKTWTQAWTRGVILDATPGDWTAPGWKGVEGLLTEGGNLCQQEDKKEIPG